MNDYIIMVQIVQIVCKNKTHLIPPYIDCLSRKYFADVNVAIPGAAVAADAPATFASISTDLDLNDLRMIEDIYLHSLESSTQYIYVKKVNELCIIAELSKRLYIADLVTEIDYLVIKEEERLFMVKPTEDLLSSMYHELLPPIIKTITNPYPYSHQQNCINLLKYFDCSDE